MAAIIERFVFIFFLLQNFNVYAFHPFSPTNHISSLKITYCSFRYASFRLWNQLIHFVSLASHVSTHLLIRCLPDPECLFYPSGLSLCLSVDHLRLVPVDDMVLFHGMVCDGWLVSYTALPCPGGSGPCTSCERVHFFLVFLDPQTKLPALSLQHKSWSSSCKWHDR